MGDTKYYYAKHKDPRLEQVQKSWVFVEEPASSTPRTSVSILLPTYIFEQGKTL